MIHFIRDAATEKLHLVVADVRDGFSTVGFSDREHHFVKRADAILVTEVSLAPGLPEVEERHA